jgi:hypothetical protein
MRLAGSNGPRTPEEALKGLSLEPYQSGMLVDGIPPDQGLSA